MDRPIIITDGMKKNRTTRIIDGDINQNPVLALLIFLINPSFEDALVVALVTAIPFTPMPG